MRGIILAKKSKRECKEEWLSAATFGYWCRVDTLAREMVGRGIDPEEAISRAQKYEHLIESFKTDESFYDLDPNVKLAREALRLAIEEEEKERA